MKRFNFRLDKVHNVAHSKAEQASLEYALAQAEVSRTKAELEELDLHKSLAEEEYLVNLHRRIRVSEALQNGQYLKQLELTKIEKNNEYEKKQLAAEDKLLEFLDLRKEAKAWSSLRNKARERHYKAEGRKEQTMLDDLVITKESWKEVR